MINTNQLRITGLAFALGLTGTAEATLLGVVQHYPDITLNNGTYLIYDHDGVDSNTGLLKLVSKTATLNEGPAWGNSTKSQAYIGSGDPNPDLMFTIAIDNATGDWSSNSSNGANKLTIGFGNNVTTAAAFSWQGDITNFGWQETPSNEAGTHFDATWKFTSDDRYVNMPANMSQFVNGWLTGFNDGGGIKISNTAGFSTLNNAFNQDWVFGTSANTTPVQTQLSSFLMNMSSISYINSTVQADVFVPVPPAFWLWAGALTSILPSVRRIKNNNSLKSA